MPEIMQYSFFQNALAACIFGGALCSIAGVLIFIKDIPFMGIALSHAAFAGATGALLIGVDPLIGALVFCLISSIILGPFSYSYNDRPNTAIGVVFSMAVGLAFLFLALAKGPKSEGLNLIWGSILTVTRGEIYIILLLSILVGIALFVFYQSIKAVIYNREIAASSGVKEKLIFYSIIIISGAVISLNLTTIGGILIFSLLINPPAAAQNLTVKLKWMFILSAVFGVVSCLTGLFLSLFFDLPSGAMIVLSSGAIYLATLFYAKSKNI